MSYEAVVFDTDGVLTRPTPTSVVRRAVRAAFAEFGVEPTTEAVDGTIHGGLTRLRRVCELYDLDPVAFWPRREAQVAAAQRLAMEAGEKPLYDDVDALDRLDVPLGVVSNDQAETVEAALDVFDLRERFPVAYGRPPTVEGFRRRKPAPDSLEAALDDLGVDDALFVGDSNVDVLAASRVGCDVAFVRRPHRADYQLAAEPTYELDSLAALPSLCASTAAGESDPNRAEG